MLESVFKKKLINRIQREFPGAIVLKVDPNYIQGITDNLILFEDKWAAFEAKRSRRASHQPNQDYYVSLLNSMSYASFVYPENEEDFIHEIQQSFKSNRTTRFSVRKQTSLG
jgi:hypothetical protein